MDNCTLQLRYSYSPALPVICYSLILQTIFQTKREIEQYQQTKAISSKVKRGKYRAAKMILIVVSLFLISWTPYSLIACIGQLGNQSLLTPWVSVLPSLFAKMSTIYNPVIYGLSHRHFRAVLKGMLQRDLRWSKSGAYPSKSSSLKISRINCRCLPLNCTSDVLDNSSSLSGKKIIVGCPQEDCRGISYRRSRAKEDVIELCVCGRTERFPRDFVPSRLRCDQPKYKYPIYRHTPKKPRVPEVKLEHRLKIQSHTSHRDHYDVPCRGIPLQCHDFANSFVHGTKHKKAPLKRRGSMESCLVHNKSRHHSRTACPSSRSMHEFYNSDHGHSVSNLHQVGKPKVEKTVPRGTQWSSRNYNPIEQPSCDFYKCRSSSHKSKMKSHIERSALLKQDSCCKTIVVKVELHHMLESTPIQNSKSVEHEGSQEKFQLISSSCSDGVATDKRCGHVHPSLSCSLMFHSESN